MLSYCTEKEKNALQLLFNRDLVGLPFVQDIIT